MIYVQYNRLIVLTRPRYRHSHLAPPMSATEGDKRHLMQADVTMRFDPGHITRRGVNAENLTS